MVRIIMSLLFFISLIQPIFCSEYSDLYITAVNDKESAIQLMTITEKRAENCNLSKGYLGAVKMVMAKHTCNPFSKMSYFKKGKLLLEQAILKDSSNAELRYLRLSIQLHVPKFLGYHSQIEMDKKFLQHRNGDIKDEKLKKLIIDIIS